MRTWGPGVLRPDNFDLERSHVQKRPVGAPGKPNRKNQVSNLEHPPQDYSPLMVLDAPSHTATFLLK